MPGQKRLAGALAAVAAAMVISACGSSSSDNATIPRNNADGLLATLNGVQDAVDAQDCDLAQERAQAFINQVNELPDTVGTDEKETLRAAGTNLEKLAEDPQQCVPDTGASGPSGTQTTTTTQETTESVPTTTVPPTTSSTTTTETTPPETGGGNEGTGGGGGEPTGTGGGGETGGGGGETGGGGEVGGGTGGTGGTGTGGTGSGGGTG